MRFVEGNVVPRPKTPILLRVGERVTFTPTGRWTLVYWSQRMGDGKLICQYRKTERNFHAASALIETATKKWVRVPRKFFVGKLMNEALFPDNRPVTITRVGARDYRIVR